MPSRVRRTVLATAATSLVALAVAAAAYAGNGGFLPGEAHSPNAHRIQTTFIVVVLVLVFSMILWGLDSLLSWIVSIVIG